MSEDFAAAYDAHVWEVYGFLAYRLGNRGEAEDLTQQTFEKALRAWNRFDPQRAPLGAWLTAIARNVLIDHYRANKSNRLEPLDRHSDSELGVQPRTEDPGVAPDLALALATLSAQDREVIALRFGADLSCPRIADLTGLSVSNVQQILSRSLRRLRASLAGSSPTADRVDDGPGHYAEDEKR